MFHMFYICVYIYTHIYIYSVACLPFIVVGETIEFEVAFPCVELNQTSYPVASAHVTDSFHA